MSQEFQNKDNLNYSMKNSANKSIMKLNTNVDINFNEERNANTFLDCNLLNLTNKTRIFDWKVVHSIFESIRDCSSVQNTNQTSKVSYTVPSNYQYHFLILI